MSEFDIEVTEEKVYPEEDYEYEGEINGKKFEGRKQTGHFPTEHYKGVNEELTDEEIEAIREKVKDKFGW
jgi:hypothetical protein